MKTNWHKILAGALTSLAATAPLLPTPWSVVVATVAAGAAAALVRPSRISRRGARISEAIPGRDVSEQDKLVDAHGAEVAELMDRAHHWTQEQSER